MSVENFPGEFRRQRVITAREQYAQAEPPSKLVWELCPYLRMHQDDSRCHQCAQWTVQDIGDGPEKWTPGCYVLAAEACRVAAAMTARLVAEGVIK